MSRRKPSDHERFDRIYAANLPLILGYAARRCAEPTDAADVTRSGQVSDRYQLGAKVTGAASCAWVQQWVHGNAAQRRQAQEAMATSRHWAILREMQASGAYPDVVWEVADFMAGKATRLPHGASLEQWAKPALGC